MKIVPKIFLPIHNYFLSPVSPEVSTPPLPVIRIPTLQNIIFWKWQDSIGNNYKNL
jgi:hypothetical protein